MSKAELEKELQSVEDSIFYLEMKDRWTDEDYRYKNQLEIQRADLKRMLKEVSE